MWLKRPKEDSHVVVAEPASEQVTEAPAGDAADPASAEVNDVPRDDAVIGPVSSLETQPEPDICPHARTASLNEHRPIWCTHQNNPIDVVREYEGARLLFLTSLFALWTLVLSEADSYIFLGENLKMLEAWFHPSKQYPAAVPMDSNTMSAITIRITFDCHYNDACRNQETSMYNSFGLLNIQASKVLKFKVLAMSGAVYACKRKVKRPRISDLASNDDG